MNNLILKVGAVLIFITSFSAKVDKTLVLNFKSNSGITQLNKEIIAYVEKHGRSISPTYEKAVCTELVIGVLKNFIILTKEDKKRIRIITNVDVYALRAHDSPIPKGVYLALTVNGKGIAIDTLKDVKPGDFVQFWYETWGHCGIVKKINLNEMTMDLYSSFPSTNGFGVQNFNIPKECYFVRLK